MKYTALKGINSGVSPICLGTMTFGTPVAEKEAADLICHAFDRGVNFIDTANMYEGYKRVAGSSGGVAEEIVGKAVKGIRSRFVIATKLGMKVGEAPEDELTSPGAIDKQLHKSLQRLSTDYIDIYYLHRHDPVTPPEEICNELGRHLKSGKIRSYGVSNYTAEQLRALLEAAVKTGIPKPVLCQPPLSLLNTGALSGLIPLCREEGIGVVPYQVLEGVLLTGKYLRGRAAPEGSRASEMPSWVSELDGSLYDRLEAIGAKALESGLSMTQYAIRWALGQPGVISALVGVKRREQIDEAVEAVISRPT